MFYFALATPVLYFEGVRRLFVSDHRSLQSIARMWWEHRMNNAEVRHHVLLADKSSVIEAIALYRLPWLGHVLRKPAYRLSCRTLCTCWAGLQEATRQLDYDLA